MEHHIISKPTTKQLNQALKEWIKLNWKAQGGLCYGMIDNESNYSILLTRTKKKTIERFKKPTELEIASFAKENSLTLKGFYDYYESNNWMVSRVKMKDWKAAARNWSERQKEYNKETAIPQPKTDKQQNIERIQEWKEKGFKSESEYSKHLFEQSMAKYKE